MTDMGRRPGDMFKADYDPDEDGLITAAEAHKTSHQSGGNDELNATGLVGRLNYVDRGDPSSADFTAFSLTQDGQWHDLALASIIPAGAIAVHLAIEVCDGMVSQRFRIKEKGNNNAKNCLIATTVVANVSAFSEGFVGVDADLKCQYDASNTTWSCMNVLVRGWLI